MVSGRELAQLPRMNALELMHKDHEELKEMLGRVDDVRSVGGREHLLEKIRHELVAHERMEEEVFYPALKSHKKAREIVLEGFEEHHVVDMVMAEIEGVPFDDEKWGAKFKVMKENIEHHIEEEENEMFKQARQVFDEDELEALGEQMTARKEQLAA
jgi:hypothetical protein